MIYRFTLGTTRTIHVDTMGSEYDTVLHLKSGSATGTEVGCNDDWGGTLGSSIDVTLGAGTYYLIVDGYSSTSSGHYLLNVTL